MSSLKAYRCKQCKKCYYTAKDLGEHKKTDHPEIVLDMIQRRKDVNSLVAAFSASYFAKQVVVDTGLPKQSSGHVLRQPHSNESAVQLPYDSTEQTGYEIPSVDPQHLASVPATASSDTVADSINEGKRSRKHKQVAKPSEVSPLPRKKGRRTKPVESSMLSENATRAATRARKPTRSKSPPRNSRGKTSCETCGLAFQSNEYLRHADICRRNLNKFSNNMSRFIRFFREYESANLS